MVLFDTLEEVLRDRGWERGIRRERRILLLRRIGNGAERRRDRGMYMNRLLDSSWLASQTSEARVLLRGRSRAMGA